MLAPRDLDPLDDIEGTAQHRCRLGGIEQRHLGSDALGKGVDFVGVHRARGPLRFFFGGGVRKHPDCRRTGVSEWSMGSGYSFRRLTRNRGERSGLATGSLSRAQHRHILPCIRRHFAA